MDYAKLLETLLPFLEKLLAAVTAAGHPGVGVSPVMGHLPGLRDELAKLRAHILAGHQAALETPHPAVVAAAKAQDTADVAQDKADAAAPKARPAAQAAADVAQDKADKAQDKAAAITA